VDFFTTVEIIRIAQKNKKVESKRAPVFSGKK
jgi:hypothetical protein